MACYMFAGMTDWSGIHTCMITCAVTAMNNVDSQVFKQRLRLIGASIGGLIGFLAMFLIPSWTISRGFCSSWEWAWG